MNGVIVSTSKVAPFDLQQFLLNVGSTQNKKFVSRRNNSIQLLEDDLKLIHLFVVVQTQIKLSLVVVEIIPSTVRLPERNPRANGLGTSLLQLTKISISKLNNGAGLLCLWFVYSVSKDGS